jgi:hypothetical protein
MLLSCRLLVFGGMLLIVAEVMARNRIADAMGRGASSRSRALPQPSRCGACKGASPYRSAGRQLLLPMKVEAGVKINDSHSSLLPGGYAFERSAPRCRREKARRCWGGRDLEEIVDIKASGESLLQSRLVKRECDKILNGVGNVYRFDG